MQLDMLFLANIHTQKILAALMRELKSVKQQISFDRRNALFENRLHVVNDVLVSHRFFLKVYIIQKKILGF